MLYAGAKTKVSDRLLSKLTEDILERRRVAIIAGSKSYSRGG